MSDYEKAILETSERLAGLVIESIKPVIIDGDGIAILRLSDGTEAMIFGTANWHDQIVCGEIEVVEKPTKLDPLT